MLRGEADRPFARYVHRFVRILLDSRYQMLVCADCPSFTDWRISKGFQRVVETVGAYKQYFRGLPAI